VRQGCLLSPALFNVYLDAAVNEWQSQLQNLKMIYNLPLSYFIEYNLEISSNKSKVMAFEGKHPRRSKIVIDNKIIEQVSHFNYLGCDVSYNYDADLLNEFQYTRVDQKILRILLPSQN
jgi:hypothetical protein